MKKLNLLSKAEMKKVMGGNPVAGECAVYVHHPNGGGYWTNKIYTVAEAQSLYNDPIIYSDYSYVTGYCCASC
ncbi:MAG: hypothetical protein V4541_01210 [Bacteroidota bacterium]